MKATREWRNDRTRELENEELCAGGIEEGHKRRVSWNRREQNRRVKVGYRRKEKRITKNYNIIL
jgi:hypothetical protein